jgi:hypothetical protein
MFADGRRCRRIVTRRKANSAVSQEETLFEDREPGVFRVHDGILTIGR